MSATPLKIKAFIGTIKERYLHGENPINSGTEWLEGLIKMELVLRGVLVSDDSKLWQQVQSSIGKRLLEGLPSPLLAGANVMAGRLAEGLASTKTLPRQTVESSILQRAKDIGDTRWLILFQQDVPWLEVARGYFCRAALTQVDTPPMWKKVWDVWTNQSGVEESDISSTPFEAQSSVENLIRIAHAKGNSKRAAELQVRLVCSYLNTKRVTVTTKKIGKEQISVAEAFGDELTRTLPTNFHKIVDKAKDLLQKIYTNELNDSDQRFMSVLKVRVAMAVEDARIEEMAEAKHHSNQNRSVSSSMQSCREKCRTKVYLEDLDPMQDDVEELRDSVVALWTLEEKEEAYWLPSLECLDQSIQRLRNRGLAQIQKNATRTHTWKLFLNCLLPLLSLWKEETKWHSDTEAKERIRLVTEWLGLRRGEEQNIVSLVSLNTSKTYWMVLPEAVDSSLQHHLEFAMDILSVLIDLESKKETQKDMAVGENKQKSSLKHKYRVARSTLQCAVAQGNPHGVDQLSTIAVATKKQGDAALGYLQCIIAWSGWHQRPWAFSSNLSDARRLLAAARQNGERGLVSVECTLLDLAQADAELLNGGFPEQAQALFSKTLEELDNLSTPSGPAAMSILRSHCYIGLARVHAVTKTNFESVKVFAEKSLDLLKDVNIPASNGPFYLWYDSSLIASAIAYQKSVSRQLIADSLISQGLVEEARAFLEAAVQDAPMDADAALSLGAFLFRVAVYMDKKMKPDAVKGAQIQLLKAAKLDPSKADSFALLGVWFEENGDDARALGCYTKSLGLDTCNPIAGRGLLRLKGREDMMVELDAAIGSNSLYCGWAWRAVGLNKLYLEAADEFAVVALLKSLRSRDVSAPMNETYGIFYNRADSGYTNERSAALAELAMSYRRMGRFTAAIRAFHAAIESDADHVPSHVLCSCAQVELELSLYDEAAAKFGLVLERDEGPSHAIAAYGQGIALHAIARRDREDGKLGSALIHIQRAISSCENFSVSFGCTRKLLGDLYSFGALLPPDLFETNERRALSISFQMEFVQKGEAAYRSVIEVVKKLSDPLKAAALCDLGSNILLQAQMEAMEDQELSKETNSLFEKARREFEASLSLDPLNAPAWCGLGCSVLLSDPLLAQHAFSRCLQIEQMFPDAYANIGFLYTSKESFDASKDVMNALTQVADTPMMWMNRAFMLESDASKCLSTNTKKAEADLSQAADAYRAAMQVMKNPESQLGLALTCRVEKGMNTFGDAKRLESLSLLKEYNSASRRFHDDVTFLEGLARLEQVSESRFRSSWIDEAVSRGEELVSPVSGEAMKAWAFNTDSIKRQIDVTSQSEDSQRHEPEIPFPFDVSTQRKILHEPHRADLWLDLARDLVSQATNKSAIESAWAASSRAVKILSNTLTHDRSESNVDSSQLAEALALSYWLGPQPDDSQEEDVKVSNEREESTLARKPIFDLQTALMVDPSNAVAREALRLHSM